MRNIIVSMRVTLDGFIAGPQGEMDWMEEFFDEALACAGYLRHLFTK